MYGRQVIIMVGCHRALKSRRTQDNKRNPGHLEAPVSVAHVNISNIAKLLNTAVATAA